MAARATAISIPDRLCNILAGNWVAFLNTVKADAKGSKNELHASKIQYMFHRNRTYLFVPEGDLHNVNTIIDERGSLSICSPIPKPLMGFLRSINKVPAHVALTGGVVRVKDNKVQAVTESIKESMLSELEKVDQASYAVSALLNSASDKCKLRCESLLKVIDEPHTFYKFDIGSCTIFDGKGGNHEFEMDEFRLSAADPILPFGKKLIDSINRSPARRRALIMFMCEYYRLTARDAVVLSVNSKGFEILAKVRQGGDNISGNAPILYHWKEFRFAFKEVAEDLEAFCAALVQLEEEMLDILRSYSGLG